MRRYYILEGDLTTANGIVQRHTGGASTTSWHGRVRSVIGDKINCPKCGSIGVIMEGVARLSVSDHNYRPALNGDLCICGCNPPPRLIHSQTIFSEDAGGEIATNKDIPSNTNISSANNKYIVQVQLLDKEQHLYSNKAYFAINENGDIFEGITDNQGLTSPIFSEKEELLSFHLVDHLYEELL